MPVVHMPAHANFTPSVAAWLTETYPTPASREGLTLWLPTTRAHGVLQAMLGAQGWVVLPTFRTLAITDQTAWELGVHDNGPPVANATLCLAHLITLWQTRKPDIPATEAARMAGGFLSLHGRLVRAGKGWGDVRHSVPDSMAQHWQEDADDLAWVGQQFEAWLSSQNLRTSAQASVVWLQRLAQTLAGTNSPHVAMGLTDVTPAAHGVMQALAHNPHGYVVLPSTPLGHDMAATLGLPATLYANATPAPTTTVGLVEAPHMAAEARTVLAVVHEALTLGRTPVAIVAAGRAVARTIHATLQANGLIPNDSKGIPLSETPTARLWLLAAQALLAPTPTTMAALCANPLVAPTTPNPLPAPWPVLAGHLEHALWRGITGNPTRWSDWQRLWRSLPYHPDAPIREAALAATPAWELLDSLLAPLANTQPAPLARWIDTIGTLLATLAPAWQAHPSAPHTQAWLNELAQLPALQTYMFNIASCFALFTTTADATPTPQPATTPNLYLWGEQEARLQRVGTLVVVGCTAEAWPPKVDDPWLSQAQLATLGLATNAHRARVAAEDWAELFQAAPHVVFTRSLTQHNATTLPSPLLTKSLTPSTQQAWRHNGQRYAQQPMPPSPTAGLGCFQPSANLIPQRWSVSLLETLRACPAKALLQRILKLTALPPFHAPTSPRELGMMLHSWLETLATIPPATQTDAHAVEAHLLAHGQAMLGKLSPAMARMWQPRLPRLTKAVAHQVATDARNGWLVDATETQLERPLNDTFSLTARADIIQAHGNLARVIDVKTGGVPGKPDMKSGKKPQLPLAAWMLQTTANPSPPAAFWELKGGGKRPLKPHTHQGNDWATTVAHAEAGATATLHAVAQGTPWPAWPNDAQGGPCGYCPYAGICRYKENA